VNSFRAKIGIIGVNPYVIPPERIMKALMKEAGKTTGPIPVRGNLNGHPYIQTVVKYSGAWRLYLNTPMRKSSGIDVGDMAAFTIRFDPQPRAFAMPEGLKIALQRNPAAHNVFNALAPSRKNEIVRYIARLKDPRVVEKNIIRAIRFLTGNGRFVGRDAP
jgi:hypothetical protein